MRMIDCTLVNKYKIFKYIGKLFILSAIIFAVCINAKLDVKAESIPLDNNSDNGANIIDFTGAVVPSGQVGSGDPVNPIDPTDPVDPTTPADPVDPATTTDPADPTNPVDPAAPTDPVNPVDPTNPTGQVVSANSVDPINPVNPIDQTNSINPGNPIDPANTADPIDPTAIVDPADPIDPVDPIEPAKKVDLVLEPIDPKAVTMQLSMTPAMSASANGIMPFADTQLPDTSADDGFILHLILFIAMAALTVYFYSMKRKYLK